MLATRCQPQFFGRIGAKTEDPIGEPLRVNQFSRVLNPINHFAIGVLRILGVESGQRAFKSFCVEGLKYAFHSHRY
jgi:hypothetical protein